jgi:Tat protein translocase TatB subunit
MFGIGLPELLLILALALIVLGPDRLPQLARQIARYMGKLKRASEELKSQLDIESLEKDIKHSKSPPFDSEEKIGTSNSKDST